jgi:glycosyltransferase involved in cell wall biosynthesis
MNKQSIKILEICPYSGGGCGVWQRVKQEAEEFVKLGYEVMVFSSNFEKGTNKILSGNENLKGINIQRFPAKKLGGESFMKFNFVKQALDYAPDVIITHNYRHLHTTQALKIRDKLEEIGKKCRVFLVTHAPFVEGNITRTKLQALIVNFYDKFIGPKTLNKFDEIIAISHWEIPYLIKAGAKKEKIVYIPNGIPEEFFTLKKQAKEENKVLFLGRIAPKKKIETIIQAIQHIKNKSLKFEIVGPQEEEYKNYLDKLINELNVSKRIAFSPPIYDLKQKIKIIDSCKIYVLASRVEGMPQGMIEAMARGKIVVGSDSIAIRDIIKDRKNGYLFEFDNPKSLAEKINFIIKHKNSKVKKHALEYVKKFRWRKIIKVYISLINQK